MNQAEPGSDEKDQNELVELINDQTQTIRLGMSSPGLELDQVQILRANQSNNRSDDKTETINNNRIWSLAWHPTLPILATSSTDKSIRLYSYSPRNGKGDGATGAGLSLESDQEEGNSKGLTGGDESSSFSFDLVDSIPTGHSRTLRTIDWRPNSRNLVIASGSFDSTTSIWSKTQNDHKAPDDRNDRLSDDVGGEGGVDDDDDDEDEWNCVMSLEGHQSEVKSVSWNRNGNLLATCSRDKTVWVWEIIIPSSSSSSNGLGGYGEDGQDDGEEGYEVVSVLMDHEQDVKSVCWSPVEDLLCSTSYDNNIHLYAEDSSSDGDFVLIHRLTGHQSTVWSASFSSCGEFIASVSDDLSMIIWHRQRIDKGGVEGRDGGQDGGWRIGRSERERWISVKTVPKIHSRTIYSVDWSLFDDLHGRAADEDSKSLGFIVTAGGDGKINVFEISREESVSGLDSSTPNLKLNLLTKRKRSHEFSDLNCISWCKISSVPNCLKDSEDGESGSNDPNSGGSDPKTSLKGWRTEAKKLLATAGDDGTVRVWRLVMKDSK